MMFDLCQNYAPDGANIKNIKIERSSGSFPNYLNVDIMLVDVSISCCALQRGRHRTVLDATTNRITSISMSVGTATSLLQKYVSVRTNHHLRTNIVQKPVIPTSVYIRMMETVVLCEN